jgi:hypothetical protein
MKTREDVGLPLKNNILLCGRGFASQVCNNNTYALIYPGFVITITLLYFEECIEENRGTMTTVGGPNDLGGSVAAGIRAKPISSDIMKHFKKNFQILIQEKFFHSYLATF